jgi:AcrR family transcriptional regulator
MAKRTRGERAGLTRERVLSVALQLVDEKGLDALTMRKLAAALGVEAMTLYHYLPNKSALLDGLVETVLDSPTRPPQQELEWNEALRHYAQEFRATLLRHPGVLPLMLTRPASTPQTLGAFERGLGVLRDAGFSIDDAVHTINSLNIFIVGHALAEVGTTRTDEEDGPGSAAALAKMDLAEFPLVVEAANSPEALDDYARFQLGVDALLAGFALRAGVGGGERRTP